MRTKQEIAEAFANRDELDGFRSFFLVGIGGAGMSGVARMLQRRGYRVRGTDSTPSPILVELAGMGIDVSVGHLADLVEEGDAVILSDAIPLDTSPEALRARELGLPLFRRSQALGWLLKGKKTVAVTGTHGKTTTTGMLASALQARGLDPTIVVGAEVPEFGGSVVEGPGEHAVIEACEAYDSLHDFDPFLVLLNNLEMDHVDFHESWENLRDSVTRFANQAEVLVYNVKDPGACEVAGRARVEKYGFDPDAPVAGSDGAVVELAQHGAHNVANANAALAVVERVAGVTDAAVRAVASFRGAERRQQVLHEGPPLGPGRLGEFTLIDDYAHHPTEVRLALQAAKDYWVGRRGRKRLVVVFQPHLYTRTAPLIAEFAQALDVADLIVMTDIYPAREEPIPGVSSFRILERCQKPGRYVPSRHLLAREVASVLEAGDVVVGMGAGNISEFGEAFLAELRSRAKGTPSVVVAYGGDSAEREVSIHSGRAVFAALERLGYPARLVDLSVLALTTGNLGLLSGPERPDLVFLATHGPRSEDGALQGLLEFFHVRYTGSGVQASAVAMDKDATKRVLREAGIPVPMGDLVRRGESPPPWSGPVVVKPNEQGSTVGLSFVSVESELERAVTRALEFDKSCLVEEWLRGVEISVPVLGGRALPPVEIVPASGSYDFESKYTPGATDEVCPARITDEQTRLAQEYALRAHEALGCRGVTRTDMIVTSERIVALEVNTLPGMTPTSLVPRSASVAGISFDDVVDWMVKDGLGEA